MIFDGIRFCTRRDIVTMGIHPAGHRHAHHIRFGRAIKEGSPIPPNAEKTSWTWNDESKTSVYAIEIPAAGYSLTNMMYGDDGRIYLMKDGRCYSAPTKRLREQRMRASQ